MTAGGHGFDGVERRGLMFVLSSPSGAGKTTLSRLLIERMPGLKMSVSATTRPMRPGEIDGRDYLFVDKPKFEQMAKQDELLEWATVFENRYGTPRAPVEAALAAGQDVLFDIDWQGTQQLREKARDDVVSVFILPPSSADLEKTPAYPCAGFGRRDTRAHEPRHPRIEPLGGIRLHRDQSRHRRGLCRSAVDPEGRAAEARTRTGLTEFVRALQRQLEK